MSIGKSVIRAFGAENRFIADQALITDENHAYNLWSLVANRFLGFYADFGGNIVILAAAMFSVAQRGDMSAAGLAGLSLSYAIGV